MANCPLPLCDIFGHRSTLSQSQPQGQQLSLPQLPRPKFQLSTVVKDCQLHSLLDLKYANSQLYGKYINSNCHSIKLLCYLQQSSSNICHKCHADNMVVQWRTLYTSWNNPLLKFFSLNIFKSVLPITYFFCIWYYFVSFCPFSLFYNEIRA